MKGSLVSRVMIFPISFKLGKLSQVKFIFSKKKEKKTSNGSFVNSLDLNKVSSGEIFREN